MVLNFISITATTFLIPLGIVAFFQGNLGLGCFDHIAALLIVLNCLYLRKSKDYVTASFVGISITLVLYFYLLVTGGVNNTAHLWYYTFPLGAAFLLGSKKGAVASAVLVIFAAVFFALDIQSPHFAHYSKDFIIRFIPSLIVVLIFSYAFEFFREAAETKLLSKNDELNRTIKELKTAEVRLRKYQAGLEKRVAERTTELSKINKDLEQEITVRELMEQERRKLEMQLAHSRKMEAIGTLAGGVAHDLNNILSATVSYPDLMLLELPADSPLKSPILMMQKSGKQAAAIVQDLLTLARRGVMATEVVNLNLIINDYMKSPEFKKLKEFHHRVKFERKLEHGLLNVSGSPLHLSKTIMNLVSNAAEAISSDGKIIISTECKYVDRPIGKYDTIEEGDYVVLTVSDTGEGLPAEDFERIFEPFYTKKKMGRSGTGLGMAVVWGTVKDHDGYIDMQSIMGKGTSFFLYFPVTKERIRARKNAIPMGDYAGKGESVLVVDDVDDQRQIASRLLTKLGYTVASVSSGEMAINYLKDNSVQLLVLDMIMDPGIDGLDTYKEILKLHPQQKAIIASGFSATERVEEAQKIGAGEYIKKPYTLEKIGVAVRSELDKEA
ncbi:MAG: response regulator, partial [Desulfobulbaceae bacterium]|nr:response regulator [Desulfobulbaceae bacterium]